MTIMERIGFCGCLLCAFILLMGIIIETIKFPIHFHLDGIAHKTIHSIYNLTGDDILDIAILH
jgi:hypothetical protein